MLNEFAHAFFGGGQQHQALAVDLKNQWLIAIDFDSVLLNQGNDWASITVNLSLYKVLIILIKIK